MSRRPNLDESRALHRLITSQEGKTVLGYLRERLAIYDKESRRMTGDNLLVVNGHRQELQELIEAAENAHKDIRGQ